MKDITIRNPAWGRFAVIAIILVGVALPEFAGAQLLCSKTNKRGKVTYKVKQSCKTNESVALDLSTGAATQQDVADLKVDVADLAANVSTLATEQNLSILQSDVETLEGDVTTVQGGVMALEGLVETLGDDVTTLQDEVPGVAFAGGDQNVDLPFTGPPLVVRSVTIDAPTDGFVVVTAGGVLVRDPGAHPLCSITTLETVEFEALINAFDGSIFNLPFAGTRGFSVAAGPTDFNLVCQDEFFGQRSAIADSYMTAVFSPVQY